MYNEQKQVKFTDAWRQGLLAKSSTASTVALSFILVITLGFAQMAVSTRSITIPTRALDAGEDVVAQVKQNGLNYYLKDAEAVSYYLSGNTSGATHVSRASSGSVTFRITKPGDNNIEHVFYRISLNPTTTQAEEFIIADNLSYHESTTTITDIATKEKYILHQTLTEQTITSKIVDNDQAFRNESCVKPKNYIPVQLVDLFSSVGIYALNNNEIAFNTVDSLNKIQPFDIKKSSKPWSDKIVGNSILTIYQPYGGIISEQHLIYDDHHQLLWQQDIDYNPKTKQIDGNAILFKVSADTFITTFPNAQPYIDQWRLSIENDNNVSF